MQYIITDRQRTLKKNVGKFSVGNMSPCGLALICARSPAATVMTFGWTWSLLLSLLVPLLGTCIFYSESLWRHQTETFSASLAICAGISPIPVNSPQKGQWRGALMISLIYAWINGWINNGEGGDLRRHRTHYDVTVMNYTIAIYTEQFVWYMNEENQTTQYEVIVKNETPYPRKHYRSWVEVSLYDRP